MTFSRVYPYIIGNYETTTYTYVTQSNGYVSVRPTQLEVKVFQINATQSETITYDNSLRFLSSVISDIKV